MACVEKLSVSEALLLEGRGKRLLSNLLCEWFPALSPVPAKALAGESWFGVIVIALDMEAY